ncbi:MAG TPA: Rieske 2Fe-2S domain-containing protein [Desulfuromonadales bacterium]|nr:Rieske 2Fe-2S domain-containing protein [Desulfuromonadales bacterium]
MISVAKTSEVPNFGKKAVSVSGREILLINLKGTFFAVENDCPHQGSPMNAGVVKDDYISCPRHGYRYKLRDGRCVEHPDYQLQVFPVQVVGDDIMIELE